MLSLTLTAWKVSKYGDFSGLYFPVFGLNRESYGVNLCIQSKYRKIWTRKNFVFGHFSRRDLTNTNARLTNTNACLQKHLQVNHCVKSVSIRSFFWSVFSPIWTEYWEILRISSYSIRMGKNKDQKNSELKHFSRSECYSEKTWKRTKENL